MIAFAHRNFNDYLDARDNDLEWNFKFHIYAEFSLSLFLDLSYDFNISYLQ